MSIYRILRTRVAQGMPQLVFCSRIARLNIRSSSTECRQVEHSMRCSSNVLCVSDSRHSHTYESTRCALLHLFSAGALMTTSVLPAREMNMVQFRSLPDSR